MIGELAELAARDSEQVGREHGNGRGHAVIARKACRNSNVFLEKRKSECARKRTGEDTFRAEIHRGIRSSARRVDDLEGKRWVDALFDEGRQAFSRGKQIVSDYKFIGENGWGQWLPREKAGSL